MSSQFAWVRLKIHYYSLACSGDKLIFICILTTLGEKVENDIILVMYNNMINNLSYCLQAKELLRRVERRQLYKCIGRTKAIEKRYQLKKVLSDHHGLIKVQEFLSCSRCMLVVTMGYNSIKGMWTFIQGLCYVMVMILLQA